MNKENNFSFSNKLVSFFSSIAPGLFIIGYIVGTGSVTTMVVSGARYGMSLTWALLLSCVFTLVMIISISKLTIVSNNTILYNFRMYVGKWITLLIILSLLITIVSSIMGVMGIITEAINEWSKPLTSDKSGIHPVWPALIIILLLNFLFWTGKHRLFIKILAVLVGLMGFSFFLTIFLVSFESVELIKGIIPNIPTDGKPHLIIAGMVGTTMASVVIISRSTLVKEEGWTKDNLKIENRDAIISLTLTFVVSASIIACAAATLFPRGITVENAIDMVKILEPLAGRFASSVFVVGIVSAGISSLFPGLVLTAWIICDFTNIKRDMSRLKFRIMFFFFSLTGLTIPIFGGKPVLIMVVSQAVSPILMPLIIIIIIILLNNRNVMANSANGLLMNTALVITLLFSIYMSYTALVGFINL